MEQVIWSVAPESITQSLERGWVPLPVALLDIDWNTLVWFTKELATILTPACTELCSCELFSKYSNLSNYSIKRLGMAWLAACAPAFCIKDPPTICDKELAFCIWPLCYMVGLIEWVERSPAIFPIITLLAKTFPLWVKLSPILFETTP